MKQTYLVFTSIVVFALLIASCSMPWVGSEPSSGTQAPGAAEAGGGSAPPIELVTIDLGEPAAGTEMEWVDGGKLVFVPGGDFMMGATGDDNPKHNVNLSSFWIYRTKVTNRMYSLCVAVGVCSPPQDQQALSDLRNQYLLDRPVVSVNWAEAQAYCEWVQGTLPTEAQWEMTARGVENSIFPWGDAAPSCDLLNFNDCLGKTSRVFDYLNGRSSFNALDMAGNAFEWALDWYDADYYPNGPDLNPNGPRVGTERVVRGSSFASGASDVPSSERFKELPEQARLDLGFRCVVEKPGAFAPYCQTSAYVPGDPGLPPPSSRCDVGNREVVRECDFVTHEIAHGGELRGVEGESPLSCEVLSGDRVRCTGPSGTTALVSVVVTCGTIGPDSRLVDPSCMAGYEPVPGAELHCEFRPDSTETVGEGGCPGGMTPIPGPGGTTLCAGRVREEREGDELIIVEELETLEPAEPLDPDAPTGEPEYLEPVEEMGPGPSDCFGGMEAGTGPDGTPVCRGTTPDGRSVECPAGMLPVLTSEGGYACIGRGGRPGEPCPPGTSLTPWPEVGGSACMGAARETLPGGELANPCIEGFTFDTALGCCQSPGGAYPGCRDGEFSDTVHGCQAAPDASGATITIITFEVSTRVCGVPPGGSKCGGLDKVSCPLTPGCTWDFGTGTCS